MIDTQTCPVFQIDFPHPNRLGFTSTAFLHLTLALLTSSHENFCLKPTYLDGNGDGSLALISVTYTSQKECQTGGFLLLTVSHATAGLLRACLAGL